MKALKIVAVALGATLAALIVIPLLVLAGLFIWLKRYTSYTIGITCGRSWYRAFPSTHKIVSCGGTMVCITAIFCKMLNQAIMGVCPQHL